MTPEPLPDYVDLRDITDDPLEALSRSAGQPFVIDVPLHKVRNLGPLAFPLSRDSGDPLAMTVRDYLSRRCRSYSGSWLEWFYSRWMPGSVAALLGLGAEEASTALTQCGAYAFVYPWGAADPRLREPRKIEAVRQENVNKGIDILGTEGSVWAGPFSKRKGDLEFSRLRLLVESISRYGYDMKSTHTEQRTINGKIVIRGDEWIIFGTHGNHRRSVLAGLGWSCAPMRIKGKIIRREAVASWPNVRNELFTTDQALRIFDRIFEGRQPPGCPLIAEAVAR